jgi:hypothetical protein
MTQLVKVKNAGAGKQLSKILLHSLNGILNAMIAAGF